MNFVQPIKDSKLVNEIAEYLKKENKRNYIMFLCGVYSALRISDILKLRVRDVKNKKYIIIREQKTKKQRHIIINQILKKELESYIQGKDLNEYLIKSRQGRNRPIGRSMAYKILKDIGDVFEIESIGTHSLRKTFGYHYYQRTKDIVRLQKILNHSSKADTLRYIGIEQESIDDAIKKFKY